MPCCCVSLMPGSSGQPGRAGCWLWQAQCRDLLLGASDKREFSGWGERRIVRAPGPQRAQPSRGAGRGISAHQGSARGGQKAQQPHGAAALRVTPSGDAQMGSSDPRGRCRAGWSLCRELVAFSHEAAAHARRGELCFPVPQSICKGVGTGF